MQTVDREHRGPVSFVARRLPIIPVQPVVSAAADAALFVRIARTLAAGSARRARRRARRTGAISSRRAFYALAAQ